MLEGLANSANQTQVSHQAISGKVQTRLDNWQLSAGARHIQHEQPTQTSEHNTVLAGAQRSFKLAERPLRVRAEYEQDIQTHDFNKTTLDAEIAVTKDTSLYGRYENGNDILGLQGLADTQRRETFKLGGKTKANKNLELYSEYRSDMLSDAIQADAEVATGLRGRYSLEKNLELQPNIEVVKAPSNSAIEDAVATSLSLNDNRKADQQSYVKLETRNSESRDFYGAKASYVAKLDEDWTGLVRDEISVDKAAEGDVKRHRFTLGAAHRPSDSKGQLNSQYLYQLKQDKQSQQAIDSTTHIVSTHQNFLTESGTEIYGRLAAKHQTQQIDAERQQSLTAMADAGINFDLSEKLSADVHAGVLSTDDGTKQYAYGAGVKVAVAENWRLGVGYNFSGFNDDDLDSTNANRAGTYMNLQAKIGEDMFKAIQPEMTSTDDKRWQYLDTPSPSQVN
jgi:opacity protein-like surface antigen